MPRASAHVRPKPFAWQTNGRSRLSVSVSDAANVSGYATPGRSAPRQSEVGNFGRNHVAIALVSPVLYAQFPGVMPKDILMGLRQMGFRHTIDMSYFLEIFHYATEEFIQRNRESGKAPWPLISPVCPGGGKTDCLSVSQPHAPCFARAEAGSPHGTGSQTTHYPLLSGIR